MNNKFARFALFTSKINRQHLQLLLVIVALGLLVLGIGAPSAVGGSGG